MHPPSYQCKGAEGVILAVIQQTASFVQKYEAEFVAHLRDHATVKQGETIKSHNKQITKSTRRIAELDKSFGSLYEDKVKGFLSEERFLQMSQSYETEQSELKALLIQLQQEIDEFNLANESIDHFVKLVKRHTDFETLTTPILNEFVDKVIVHESTWSHSTPEQRRRGTRTQQVDVYLKYIGHVTLPDKRSREQMEQDKIATEEREAQRLKQQKAGWAYYERRKAKQAASVVQEPINDLTAIAQ